jgi:ribokinase
LSCPTVLVVGGLHYDIMVEATHLPRRDETAIGTRWYPKFGGKGGNQAVSCVRQGAPARFLGATGADDFGAFLTAGLTTGGVDISFLGQLPGTSSGMSVAIQDSLGDYAAIIVSGANLSIDPAWLDDDGLWNGVGLLVLQNEVPEAVNQAAATKARNRGHPRYPERRSVPALVERVCTACRHSGRERRGGRNDGRAGSMLSGRRLGSGTSSGVPL